MINPQAIIADVAEKEIGAQEITPNQNPAFQKYWNATTNPEGMSARWPYCSAFASYCVDEGDRLSDDIKLRRPAGFPGVSQWLDWAALPDSGAMVFKFGENGFYPQRGDVVVFLPHLSHCGIVRRDWTQGVSLIHTIEANTSPGSAGSQRDGDGVWPKDRAIDFCGTFIRIPTIAQKA